MAFERRLDDSDELLRGVLQSLYLAPQWSQVKATIAVQLKAFEPEEVRTKGLDSLLAQQLVLDTVGSELREMWGLQDVYDSALLREPYLPKARRIELTNSITNQLQHRIDELVASSASEIAASGHQAEAEAILDELIAFKRAQQAQPDNFQEIVGKALVQTLKKNDFIIRLMSSTGTSPAESAQSREPPAAAADHLTTSLETLLSSDTNREVAEITEGYSQAAMDDICLRLRGVLLSDSLRSSIWAFAFLSRNYGEAPVGVSNMRELARLAQLKGYKIGDISSSPIADLVSRAVSHALQGCLKTSMQAADRSSPAYVTLTKRIEVLVHAAFILTNVFSERVVVVAILLMRVFPQDAPVSEKILKILVRITAECLPAEQLHKEYSIASVAQDTWLLLLQRDAPLHAALQNAPPSSSSSSSASPDGSTAALSIPQSLVCLKGWLETGFFGWLPEHAAMFLWDQLTLEGAKPATFQSLLPALCFVLLEMLREPLLACRDDVVECIRRNGRALRTKDVIRIVSAILS